jgi:DNA-binding Xre family transcriptional regulator
MAAYRQRTGERMTYPLLAKRIGVSRATVESIATRPGYNPSLETIARLCVALQCNLDELLILKASGAKRRRVQK